MGVGGGDDHTSSCGFNHHLHQIKTKFHFIYRNFIEKIQLLQLCRLLLRASYRSSFHQHSGGKKFKKITGVITDAKFCLVAATTICLSMQDNK